MKKGKAVVIFSGGQDSTTCLFWALNRHEVVEAITFDYGQKHLVEIEQSKIICQHLNVKQTIVELSVFNVLAVIPGSFVPNRNQLFTTIAHSYAQKIDAKYLIAGMCQTDYNDYPDCRHSYLQRLIRTTNRGSGLNNLDGIILLTPLMRLTKAETFQLAAKEECLKDVLEMSHTCYNGDRNHRHEWGYGCGECAACELRLEGWHAFLLNNNFQIENYR